MTRERYWRSRTCISARAAFTVNLRRCLLREREAEVAGANGADDCIAIARSVDFDPRPAEVRRAVGIVSRDLRHRNRVGIVERPIEAGLRDFDGLDGPA